MEPSAEGSDHPSCGQFRSFAMSSRTEGSDHPSCGQFRSFAMSSSFVGDAILRHLTHQPEPIVWTFEGGSYTMTLGLFGSMFRRYIQLCDQSLVPKKTKIVVPKRTSIVIVVTNEQTNQVIQRGTLQFRDSVARKVYEWLDQALRDSELLIQHDSVTWNTTGSRALDESAVLLVPIHDGENTHQLEFVFSFCFNDGFLPICFEDAIVLDLITQSVVHHKYFAVHAQHINVSHALHNIRNNMMTFTDNEFQPCQPHSVVSNLPLYKLAKWAHNYTFSFRLDFREQFFQSMLEYDFQSSLLQGNLKEWSEDGNHITKDAKQLFKDYWISTKHDPYTHVKFNKFTCDKFTKKYVTYLESLERNEHRSGVRNEELVPKIAGLRELLPSLAEVHCMSFLGLKQLLFQHLCTASTSFNGYCLDPSTNVSQDSQDSLLSLGRGLAKKTELMKLFTVFVKHCTARQPKLVNHRHRTKVKKNAATTVFNCMQLNVDRLFRFLKQLIRLHFPLKAKQVSSILFQQLLDKLLLELLHTEERGNDFDQQLKHDLLVLLHRSHKRLSPSGIELEDHEANTTLTETEKAFVAKHFVHEANDASVALLNGMMTSFLDAFELVKQECRRWIKYVASNLNLENLSFSLRDADKEDEDEVEENDNEESDRCTVQFTLGENATQVEPLGVSRLVICGMVFLLNPIHQQLFAETAVDEKVQKTKKRRRWKNDGKPERSKKNNRNVRTKRKGNKKAKHTASRRRSVRLRRRANRRKRCACEKQKKGVSTVNKEVDTSKRIVNAYQTYSFRPNSKEYIGLPSPTLDSIAISFEPCSFDEKQMIGYSSTLVFEEIASLLSQHRHRMTSSMPLFGKSILFNGVALYVNALKLTGIKGSKKRKKKKQKKDESRGKKKDEKDERNDLIEFCKLVDAVNKELDDLDVEVDRDSTILERELLVSIDWSPREDMFMLSSRQNSTFGRQTRVNWVKFGNQDDEDEGLRHVPGFLALNRREIQTKEGSLKLGLRKKQLKEAITLEHHPQLVSTPGAEELKCDNLYSLTSKLSDYQRYHFLLYAYVKSNYKLFNALYSDIDVPLPKLYGKESSTPPIDACKSLPSLHAKLSDVKKFSLSNIFLKKLMNTPLVKLVLQQHDRDEHDYQFILSNMAIVADLKLQFRGLTRSRYLKAFKQLGIPVVHTSEFRTSQAHLDDTGDDIENRRCFKPLRATCHCHRKARISIHKLVQDSGCKRNVMNRDHKAAIAMHHLGRSTLQKKCKPIAFLPASSALLRRRAMEARRAEQFLEQMKQLQLEVQSAEQLMQLRHSEPPTEVRSQTQQTTSGPQQENWQNVYIDVHASTASNGQGQQQDNNNNKLSGFVVKKTVQLALELKSTQITSDNRKKTARWIAHSIHLLNNGVYQPPEYKW